MVETAETWDVQNEKVRELLKMKKNTEFARTCGGGNYKEEDGKL